MIRQIISIDREKCNGCGLCVDVCDEGAIAMINGKAKLLREDHCDGLGNCLPACPSGAITFVTKDTLPFDDEPDGIPLMVQGCSCIDDVKKRPGSDGDMTRWPIQLKLVPLGAPFLKDADILVAADCAAFVRADFRDAYVQDRVILIGCPKLDHEDYGQRLTEIIGKNHVRSVTLVRLDIPCCAAFSRMVREALAMVTDSVPLKTVVLTTDGAVVE